MLCTNHRVLLPGSPSTCTIDTALIPLPSFILFAFLTVYTLLRIIRTQSQAQKSNEDSYPIGIRTEPRNGSSYASESLFGTSRFSTSGKSMSNGLALSLDTDLDFRRTRPYKWGHKLYVALIVCLFLLRVLELVRLGLAGMGLGFLPVALVGDVIALVMVCCSRSWGSWCSIIGWGVDRGLVISLSLVIHWALSLVFEAIKVARLIMYESAFSAKGTKYPSSDWVLDNACMLGLYAFFFFWEGAYLILLWRASLYSEDNNKDLNREEGRAKGEQDTILRHNTSLSIDNSNGFNPYSDYRDTSVPTNVSTQSSPKRTLADTDFHSLRNGLIESRSHWLQSMERENMEQSNRIQEKKGLKKFIPGFMHNGLNGTDHF